MPRGKALTASISASIETAFSRIARERMAGIPILNPMLRVEVFGVRHWQGCWVAILITPWCMNLILLPAREALSGAGQARRFHRFPSGDYAFLPGHEAEIGEYHSCALISPMAQFVDQDSVRAVAAAALERLFLPAAPASPCEAQSGRAGGAVAAGPWLSRRRFLTGGMSRRAGAAPALGANRGLD